MKHTYLILLLVLFKPAFTQSYSTLNLYSSNMGAAVIVTVFLNDEIAGNMRDNENLQCKIYSEGRITVTVTVTEPAANIRRTSVIDVKKGGTYYMAMKYNYTYSAVNEEAWKTYEPSITNVVKFEENKRRPIIRGGEDKDDGPKQGTGFLVSKKGYVITNYHVISNAKTVQLKGVGGDFSTLYGMEVVAVDVDNDFALLRFKNQALVFEEPPYAISKSTLAQGSKAFVLGYPLAKSMGEEIKLTDGLISAKSGFKGSLSQYQFSAPIQPGNSGSPLFNENGDIVGVANAKLEGAEGAGYAIKSQYLLTFATLIDNFALPVTINQIKALSLNDKVSKLKNFIYIIKTEGE
ncbi:MAG TPA: serine protease [Chitinophagales bacterium]|nr:serine protease [Chitinophagales bacterium]